MKLRKASGVDILWFTALLTVFIIVARTQLEFYSTATVDTYVKNIVNAEATTFVNSIAGFSTNGATLNMYDSNGNKRALGSPSDLASSINSTPATAYGIVNRAKQNMIDAIKNEFLSNPTLVSKTSGVSNSSIDVSMTDKTGKSTIVTVTFTYTVTNKSYSGKEGGLFKLDSLEIPRKVVVTRTIENPLRFR